MFRWPKRLFYTQAPRSPPRTFPNLGFQRLPASIKVEEETLELPMSVFYNVRIGEVFEARYQALSKLGWGTSATVWLCRDLQDHKYVALKVFVRGHPSAQRESNAADRLGSLTKSSIAIQKCYGHFTARKTNADSNDCFIFEALGRSLADMRQLFPDGQWPFLLFRVMVINILQSLAFLHNEANLIHCDLRQNNFLMRTKDDSIFRLMEEMEQTKPSPRKEVGADVVHTTSTQPLPSGGWGIQHAVLSDFGEARVGSNGPIAERIQPFEYRAPEILLVIPWSYPVDVWNAGLMLWDMFEGESLFDPFLEDGEVNDLKHLLQMIALMGNPPLEFLKRSTSFDVLTGDNGFFKQDGSLKDGLVPPKLSLADKETRLDGEEKVEFLRFMRRFFTWDPEQRPTVVELLKDPFLAIKRPS